MIHSRKYSKTAWHGDKIYHLPAQPLFLQQMTRINGATLTLWHARTESDLEAADHEGQEAVVAEAAAVVGCGVGAGSALEEAVHLPLEERQGAW